MRSGRRGVAFDASRDHVQLSPPRAAGGGNPRPVDGHLEVRGRVDRSTTRAFPDVLVGVERAVFNPLTGRHRPPADAAIRQIRSPQRQERPQHCRRLPVRQPAAPLGEQVRVFRCDARGQGACERPLDARASAATRTAVIPTAGHDHRAKEAAHATLTPIFDSLASLACRARPVGRRLHLHLIGHDHRLDRVEHGLAVAERQTHVLRLKPCGRPCNRDDITSVQHLAYEPALDLNHPFHRSLRVHSRPCAGVLSARRSGIAARCEALQPWWDGGCPPPGS